MTDEGFIGASVAIGMLAYVILMLFLYRWLMAKRKLNRRKKHA